MREFSDRWVLAARSVNRIARRPDLLVGYTVQPLMFPLAFGTLAIWRYRRVVAD